MGQLKKVTIIDILSVDCLARGDESKWLFNRRGVDKSWGNINKPADCWKGVGDGRGLLGDNDNRRMTVILTISEASGCCRLDMEY